MHDIEPYYKWREHYIASEDKDSPFYNRSYSEFSFSNKVYNYFIHPQWDDFGSNTLYAKILMVDYIQKYTIIELIGEWNDTLENDVMTFKQKVLNHLVGKGISKIILVMDNVLNFHSGDDDYYIELHEDLAELEGYICMINTFDHVMREMETAGLQYYVGFGNYLNMLDWRGKNPDHVLKEVESRMNNVQKQLI